MTQLPDALQTVLLTIDAANSRDPNDEGGQPAALLYGQRMSARLAQFAPAASAALQIAVRGQHIERWTLPRKEFAMDRAGYFAWRNALKEIHAQRLADIMAAAGYDAAHIARVGQIVRKEKLKADPEAQVLEDVACLVFLEFYADAFAAKQGAEKSIDILRKTWRKMSAAGQEAVQNLTLTQQCADLIARAFR